MAVAALSCSRDCSGLWEMTGRRLRAAQTLGSSQVPYMLIPTNTQQPLLQSSSFMHSGVTVSVSESSNSRFEPSCPVLAQGAEPACKTPEWVLNFPVTRGREKPG